jgi:hypothetical protein
MSHSTTNTNNHEDGDDISSSDEGTGSDDPDGNSEQDAPVDRVLNPAGVAAVIHEKGSEGQKERIKIYLRGSGIVYRAMHLLDEWKYMTARISSAKVPVDIIALRNDVVLLVQVISSRKPLPDAKAVLRHYAEKIGNLRCMGTSQQFRKMLLAYSRSCGWKYFEVLPSGLIPAWNVPAVPDS